MEPNVAIAPMSLRLPDDLALPTPGGLAPTRLLKTAVTRAQLLRLALRGLNARQASEALGVSVYTARSHYADPAFRTQVLSRVEGALAYADEKFDAQAKSLHIRLAEKSERAFDILCDLLEGERTPIGLRAKIGLEFMDRHPDLSAIHKSEHLHEHRMSSDDLVLAARTATEMDSRVIPIRKATSL